jgi:5'-3' exoribonuclease 1
MMNIYRDLMPRLGGYLTDKTQVHLLRVEAFLQEVSRREPLYFQQRAIEEKDPVYASDRYKQHYYENKFSLEGSAAERAPPALLETYLQGLVWVLNYYHNGCASW